jgi:1-acyl-sn-glycerol-3-phosphate acyltransferase
MFEDDRVILSKPNALRALVGRTWLKSHGWSVDGSAPRVKKAVIVAAPHTSNWDLPFTLAAAYQLGVDLNWVAKKEIFRPPFKSMFEWLGGIPVDRSKKEGFTTAIARRMREAESLYLIIAPEGTRSKVTRWKTGFYHIAVEAGVPIVLGYLDYSKKVGGFGHLFYPTGDIERDFAQIGEFYSDKRGKHVGNSGPITLVASAQDLAHMERNKAEAAERAASASATR